jgi:glycolate oxidase FAD binding subunit
MRLDDAFGLMTSLLSRPLPVSASAFDDGLLRVRLSGSEAAVKAAGDELGGELDGSADTFWTQLKEQQLDFFLEDLPLWRVNVKPQDLPIDLPGRSIIDWGGALYWLKADIRLGELTEIVRPFGGWVTGFRSADQDRDFNSPEGSILQLNRRLKKAFDPAGILNPDRLFSHD